MNNSQHPKGSSGTRSQVEEVPPSTEADVFAAANRITCQGLTDPIPRDGSPEPGSNLFSATSNAGGE